MREELATDQLVARMAARQHGVVSVRQLAYAGVGRSAISRRLRAGRLHRVYRGIYAVGHPSLSREGRWLAAVLACGPGAVLSHLCGAALWELWPWSLAVIDITVPGLGGRAHRSGIVLHRSKTLGEHDTTVRLGIPVTTPDRTIADLKHVLSRAQLEKVIGRAEALGLAVGRPLGLEPDMTRSELERRFLRLCRRHGLALPTVNARVGRLEVDFLWPDSRLIVEVDGFRYHGGRSAFEADRARDVRLKLLGYEVLRFTHRHLHDDPQAVAAAVAALAPSSRYAGRKRQKEGPA
jgi:very-short-patch-repair endonuclease